MVNPLTQLVQIALLVLAILVLLLVASARFTTHVGEDCALILFATTAMMLLVSTQNLLLVFIAIEFSLSVFRFTSSPRLISRASHPRKLGSSTSVWRHVGEILLFGFSLLYGLSGSLALQGVAAAVNAAPGDPLLTIAIVLVVAGLGFKIAAAPFHMWAPEVYQGAPTRAPRWSHRVQRLRVPGLVCVLPSGAHGSGG